MKTTTANRINLLAKKKKCIYFNKILASSFLFLSVLVCCVIACGETTFSMLAYDAIPEDIRDIANIEIAKQLSEGIRSGRTYEGSGYAAKFAESFDAMRDSHTTQSKIYIDDLHSYIWNIAYFAIGTREFIGTVLMDVEGKVLFSYAGWYPEFTEILEEKVGKSFYDWTFEEQFAYDELFIRSTFVDGPRWHHSLPKPDDLPRELLIDIGKKFLLEYYFVPEEEIEEYKVQHLYYIGAGYPDDLGAEEGKWVLRFVKSNSPRPYEYAVTLSAVNGTVYFSTPFPTNP